MLQGVRDNMKGTLVAVVVVLFIIPMVLSGIGGSFLGSVAGTDAASVQGESISKTELRREMYMQKQRLLSQGGVDPASDMLKDENLQGPVLNQLTRRTALLVAAKDAGMAVSDELVGKEIVKSQEFYTDGKFDQEKFRRLLANVGYTPATYKTAIAKDLLLNQSANGLRSSSFVTESEISQFAALLHQKRSFFTVEIPQGDLESTIVISDDQIQKYYDEHQDEFNESEKVSIEYIELSVDDLMKDIVIDEADVKATFESELESFDAKPEFEIAHLLIEDGDGSEEKVAEVQSKVTQGDAFEELVKTYSDDAGSKESGGVLGVMATGFPEEFFAAVENLNAGDVSSPVKTPAGTHFIKVLKKTVPEPPSFEDRKVAIETQLQRTRAEDIYIEKLESLGDLTYSAQGLQDAAEQLGLTVKTTEPFSSFGGEGIAARNEVRTAAFDKDVLDDGHNSSVIELANDRAVVIRKLAFMPEHIKPLEIVKADIKTNLTKLEVQAQLEAKAAEFIAKVKTQEEASTLASELKYGFVQHDGAKRTDPVVDRRVRERVFAMAAPKESSIEFSKEVNNSGDYVVIGLQSVVPGTTTDIEEQQLKALDAQLASQQSMSETSAYQDEIINSANIKIH